MEINKTLNGIERGFNIAGGMPIVAIFSGALRTQVAQVQFVAGVVLGIIGLIGQMFSDQKKWEEFAQRGFEHVIHGALNFVRGFSEVLVGMTILGSPLLLIPQYKNNFEPIYKYEDQPAPAAV